MKLEINKKHKNINLSEIISIEEIACDDDFDIFNNTYKHSLFNKEHILNGAILIGILSGLGLAYQENKDKALVNISNQSKHLFIVNKCFLFYTNIR